MTARSVPEWIGKRPESMPGQIVAYRTRQRGEPLTLAYFIAASMPEPNSGCWIWLKAYSATNGYGVMRDGGRCHRAHRRAFEVANNCIVPRAIDVCHRCDNRLCVNPDHLFLGSREDNMRDCARKGRIRIPNLRGTALSQAKLTEADVRAIRTDARSHRAIARDYGVDRGTIRFVLSRKTWRHVV